MTGDKKYILDLQQVLYALDNRDLDYYDRLTDKEKKGYTPLVLMRYMSSLTSQNSNCAYAVIATNDVVNLGFWTLSKYPDLQHKLLCVTGLGGSQKRPWIAAKNTKKKNKIDSWLLEKFPELNDEEISILKSQHDSKSWNAFVKGSGATDAEVKEMTAAWSKEK